MTTATRTTPVRRAAHARLTIAAGWSAIVVALLHIAVFVPQSPWTAWFDGGLRTAEPDVESVALFWALPGGIAVPALLFGAMVVRLGRLGQRVGLPTTVGIAVWVAVCLWLIGPSGFMALLVTVGLLVAARIADRR